jgi:hypothetical protein
MRLLIAAVGIAAILVTFYSGFRAAAHLRPGEPQWKAFANWTADDPQLYSPEGRRHYRRSVWARIVFFGALLVYVMLR